MGGGAEVRVVRVSEFRSCRLRRQRDLRWGDLRPRRGGQWLRRLLPRSTSFTETKKQSPNTSARANNTLPTTQVTRLPHRGAC